MDDEIIYSWCFNDVECFDSTPSAAIIILDKDLESFSSLRSQHSHAHTHSHTFAHAHVAVSHVAMWHAFFFSLVPRQLPCQHAKIKILF